jgi:hypothetical protein
MELKVVRSPRAYTSHPILIGVRREQVAWMLARYRAGGNVVMVSGLPDFNRVLITPPWLLNRARTTGMYHELGVHLDITQPSAGRLMYEYMTKLPKWGSSTGRRRWKEFNPTEDK